ncbi:MAG TPA: ADP-forming succinate--CoA ligase subunit beta [Gemmatimonadales bacterium]|nr:ADP-forming succinate--CoA ligase subunit beta [Gemmatimonadales bacterium]
MNLHEYQARDLLERRGVPFLPGGLAASPEEAAAVARRLGGPVVVKAQVHAGGRGKAGAVRRAAGPEEAARAAEAILGMTLQGLAVRRVLLVAAASVQSEAYLGVTLDRAAARPVLIASPAGGVDIEEVAAATPERVHRALIDPRYGLLPHQAMGLAFALYRDLVHVRAGAAIMHALANTFWEVGASLAEINPLATDGGGRLVALDSKIVIDDNELSRHPELEALRDASAESAADAQARAAGLSFIKLDGSVGCCVNGAGLAMATMDLVRFYGGSPANFLDIGGSSSPEKVVAALDIITADPAVRVILFNIFGGITRCDDVATGIVRATEQFHRRVPLVIRLTGTNEDEAIRILTQAGFRADTDMDEAVEHAVALAR